MFEHPGQYPRRGRPSQFDRFLELAKIAWSPVLEALGMEIPFGSFDSTPYRFVQPFPFWKETLARDRKRLKEHPTLKWVSSDQVVRIHDEMIRTFGGSYGAIDAAKVSTALDRARYSSVGGRDQFPSVLHKAAAIMHQILVYHPFVDGQKRTGISTAFIFLALNDYLLWSRNAPDEVHFAVRVAKGDYEVREITKWLAARVLPSEAIHSPFASQDLLSKTVSKRRRCPNCSQRLSIGAYEVTCGKCGRHYRVIVNSGLLDVRTNSLRVEFGLRKVD